jgi:glutamate-1-semialdehyde 2,1-aminomutase
MNAIAKADPGLEQVLRTVEERFAADNPQSRARHERACRVLPAGHSRQTLYYAPFPLTIARGSGARIVDLDGHDYLNLVGDYAAGVFGHSCEPIQRAVREALDGGVSLSGVNTREVELAELIAERIPSMQQVRFCNSGSEACLFAAQLARHATGRQKLMVFNGCYHGGFMIYGARDPALSVPFAVVKATYNDVEGARAILRANAPDIAAVFVEPMMGAAGCIPGSLEFLGMLREETRRLGVLLIFDEVMTSRLGPGGVQGLLGLRPDLTTLGKFWGGGLAFGAFGGAPDLMRHFDTRSGGTLAQAGTFNNNIVAMTAGLVGARDVYTPTACTQLNGAGDRLRADLNALGRRRGLAFQSTGLGAVQNIHWSASEITEPSRVLPVQHPLRRLFHLELLSRGYYIAQRGMVSLSLPVTTGELANFLAAADAVLALHADLLPKRDATTTRTAGDC